MADFSIDVYANAENYTKPFDRGNYTIGPSNPFTGLAASLKASNDRFDNAVTSIQQQGDNPFRQFENFVKRALGYGSRNGALAVQGGLTGLVATGVVLVVLTSVFARAAHGKRGRR